MNIDWDNPYDGGAGETIDRELARASDPGHAQRVATRPGIGVRVPDLDGVRIEMSELRAASAALDAQRVRLAEATAALNALENGRNSARQRDAEAGAAAFREGKPAPTTTALAALEVEIGKAATRRSHGVTAVAQVAEELARVTDEMRATYRDRADKAIMADRDDAIAALDAFVDARSRLLGSLTVKNWLSGEPKWSVGQLPELRGVGASDRPAPSFATVEAALRRQLTPSAER